MTAFKTLLPALGVALLIGAGATVPAYAKTPGVDTNDAYIIAFDQKANDSMSVAFARLPHDGYVAIYEGDANGKAKGEALGVTQLTAGNHNDVEVKLSTKPAAGTKLLVSLYQDVDQDQTFKPDSDKGYWAKDAIPQGNWILAN